MVQLRVRVVCCTLPHSAAQVLVFAGMHGRRSTGGQISSFRFIPVVEVLVLRHNKIEITLLIYSPLRMSLRHAW